MSMSVFKQATHYNYGKVGDWSKETYADFGDGRDRVYDHQVASYTKKHLSLLDRLNLRKVVAASMYSFGILSGSVEEPNIGKKNWKYFKDV